MNHEDVICAILAGGEGKRLRPILKDKLPKCLAPIVGKPFLQYQIEHLRRKGFKKFLLCVGKMASKIEKVMGDGRRLGVEIIYSRESKPLGTAGAIKNAAPYLKKVFLVVNGDTYLNIDYKLFLKYHLKKRSKLSVAVTRRSESESYGVVSLDSKNRIMAFSGDGATIEGGYVSGGAYIVDPLTLNFIPKHSFISLEQEVIPEFINSGIGCYGYIFKGRFYDIGTPDRYAIFKKFLRKEDYDI